MTPYFNPGPIEHPNISVHVSAVGPRMARMAGEISDGVGWHRFHTAQYLKEVVIKNLHEGARAAGRDPASLRVSGTGFIVTGRTQEELERGRQVARGEIAFYGSTPAYHPVLELHGWQDIGHQLHQMSVSGQWREMSKVITEEMLDAFTITATYDKIIPKIRERYGSFATGINFSIPVKGPADEELLADMVKQLKA
jgi:probable F420-dependent oxidoreductase